MAAAMLTRTTIVCLAFLFLGFLIPLLVAHGGGSGSDDDDHDDAKPNLRTKSLILVKIWCLIIVFIATFAGGVSPYFFRWNQTFLSLGTQFAGWVFLGTALMHFLSDSAEMFSDLTEKKVSLCIHALHCGISAYYAGRPGRHLGLRQAIKQDRNGPCSFGTKRDSINSHSRSPIISIPSLQVHLPLTMLYSSR